MLTHVNTQTLAEDSDIIFIQDLKITTRIGVYTWEKSIPQPIILNLRLAPSHPVPSSIAEDNLKNTVDYAKIIQWLKVWVPEQKIQLIETLAETITQELLKNYPLKFVDINIRKPNAQPNTAAVGIHIRRYAT